MTKGTPALVAQLDLIEWTKTRIAESWGRWVLSGSPGFDLDGQQRALEGMGRILSENLGMSETVFISRDMCTIIEAAAETLPDVPLQEVNLFWPSAFLYYERPIRHTSSMTPADGDLIVHTRAIQFGPSPVMDTDAALAAAAEEGLENFTDLGEDRLRGEFTDDGVSQVTFVDTEAITKVLGYTSSEIGTNLFPFDLSGWLYGKTWETIDSYDEVYRTRKSENGVVEVDLGLSQQRKLLLATLLIAQQYIAVRSSTKATRQVRRRAERMDADLPNYGDITYVTLRRNSATSKEREGNDEFEYSHRFMVKGFWKHQWYPSKGEHHLIWIDPYIKGPKHKPLIIKDKIYKLIR